ncbi:protein-methionine-sulfoxide reductase heme-binding subunit MsrQ [Dokdonella sp.]|uniref:sulfite oxidase heme-binding subunit YedZ n=1 Tax=Dokdonella sp. TaxID=2291710 RepID=UPI0025C71C67|nr:protein-methionine-sulfoxide reductase heme-binding subunit MsrQ [Dokdonella sp.]MBX3693172.1 sulfoxide reductase heme-binding subunit YedZ [Dokdonella sp.]MCW5568224.1 sulfoxide reductase heme-binding subunit YedZ [Dokdonella sp.]
MPHRLDRVAASKPFVFAAALLPLALLVLATHSGTLGPDPVATLEHETGLWALRFLLATLAITPLRRATGWHWLLRYRRMLGLFTFFYASLHLVIYLVVDLGGFWAQVFGEIAKKPFITVGFLAWLLMIPLALTSTKAMMRRLGRRWAVLHRLVYAIGALAVLHFLWQVKWGETIAAPEPVIYATVFAALMLARLMQRK